MTQIIYEPSKTTHWKNLFPNKSMLLGSHNLNPGEELIATIKSVTIEKITNQNGQEEQVPVIKFSNEVPPMVLNITNSRSISILYGDHYDDWIGKSIQIFATKVKAFGEEVSALRVREQKPVENTDLSFYEEGIKSAKTLVDLKKAFMSLPKNIKPKLQDLKNKRKQELS